MAITRDPFHCAEASGTCGPLVAVRGRRGTNMRAWQNQCDPKSRLQTWNRREIFARASHWWIVMSDADRLKWEEFARTWAGSGGRGNGVHLSGRHWWMKYRIRSFRYRTWETFDPPVSPLASYIPDLSVEWTGAGAILSWSPAIADWHRIVVRQARNETKARMRPVEGEVSHILHEGSVSPVNITGPVGGPAEPAGWAPVVGSSTLHVHVWALDNYVRSTPVMFWRILIP